MHEQAYKTWSTQLLDDYLVDEMNQLQEDPKAIEDCFYQYLSFGTGGMRGIIGVGTNRMNIYTIRRVAYGLAKQIEDAGPEAMERGVVIAYDTRHFSYEFAIETAKTVGQLGIRTYVFKESRPTPQLSFAIRHLNAFAGVVITASHNPSEYNGFKVYGEDGGQLPPEAANHIVEYMDAIEDLFAIEVATVEQLEETQLLTFVLEDIDEAYQEQLITLREDQAVIQAESNLSIVYSSLHGSGLVPVVDGLKSFGFENVAVVEEQAIQNGAFPTVVYPNPEERDAFTLAIELGQKQDADLLLATDPDADRLGVAVKTGEGQYELLTGNQLGALLMNYVLTQKQAKGTLPQNGVVMKTIVTSELGRAVANKFNLPTIDTLTGFKFISEKVEEFTETNEHTFLFGYEESYGYLIGTFARDKDAVQAAILTAEMTAYYKSKGQSLYNGLIALYEELGYYREALHSITLKGKDGQAQIAEIMDNFRLNPPTKIAGIDVVTIEDYEQGKKRYANGEEEILTLPKSNVLKFLLADDTWVCARPSGTEPKCKFYVGVKKKTNDEAEKAVEEILAFIQNEYL